MKKHVVEYIVEGIITLHSFSVWTRRDAIKALLPPIRIPFVILHDERHTERKFTVSSMMDLCGVRDYSFVTIALYDDKDVDPVTSTHQHVWRMIDSGSLPACCVIMQDNQSINDGNAHFMFYNHKIVSTFDLFTVKDIDASTGNTFPVYSINQQGARKALLHVRTMDQLLSLDIFQKSSVEFKVDPQLTQSQLDKIQEQINKSSRKTQTLMAPSSIVIETSHGEEPQAVLADQSTHEPLVSNTRQCLQNHPLGGHYSLLENTRAEYGDLFDSSLPLDDLVDALHYDPSAVACSLSAQGARVLHSIVSLIHAPNECVLIKRRAVESICPPLIAPRSHWQPCTLASFFQKIYIIADESTPHWN